ncbi:FAD linked oxidase [Actinosynnema sp. ALI-1.44]|uniref:FAD-binding protein n=1 Tax=Actinosynnema sp. ALI-1.44 TaxID=1933779 RepID=UPI00097C56E7|nr:FAD-binding protein [Actinosynnema sp. ALI-1.44]ONI81652.1 FAD linked oxidase [Actinosynnema sp. ALI-1.44]
MEPPHLDGELLKDEASRQAAAVDFGNLVHNVPIGVLRPGSTADVGRILRWMGDEGKQVTPQGERHSVYGRSQVDGGVVVDMSGRKDVHSVERDRIVVDAGAKWSDVLDAALQEGLTPPVLTEYLELSVGGTIVVGGVGGTTWRYGTQSDTVLELEVVTGDGRVITCSPDREPRLFDAMRAGLGQVGIISRATLSLTPAQDSARRYQLIYGDLDTMLADQRVLLREGRWDYLQGAAVPGEAGGWTYLVDGSKLFSGADAPDDDALLAGLSDDRAQAQIGTFPYSDYAYRFAPLEKSLRSNGHWFHPHPWLATFIGDSAAQSVLAAELDLLSMADLGTYGRVLIFPLRTRSIRSPLMRLPAEEVSFAFNLLRFPVTDSEEAANAMVKANRAIYERVRAAGGTLNPVSAFPMSTEEWRTHFGSRWDGLCTAKELYDPKHVLTPGYEVF